MALCTAYMLGKNLPLVFGPQDRWDMPPVETVGCRSQGGFVGLHNLRGPETFRCGAKRRVKVVVVVVLVGVILVVWVCCCCCCCWWWWWWCCSCIVVVVVKWWRLFACFGWDFVIQCIDPPLNSQTNLVPWLKARIGIGNLVGGWTNPSEKYARQIGSFPQGSGWK